MKYNALIEEIESKFEKNRLTLWDVVEKLQTTKLRSDDLTDELFERETDAPSALDVLVMDVLETIPRRTPTTVEYLQ